MAVVIPKTKSEVVFSTNATEAGTATVDVLIENDALSFVVLAEQVDTSVSVDVFEIKNQATIGSAKISTSALSGSDSTFRFSEVMDNQARMVITWGAGTSNFSIVAKAISAAGVPITQSGSGKATAKQATLGTTTIVLIASAISGRDSVIVKNWDASGVCYIGFTASEATTANGYPLAAGESIGISVDAGVSVYAVGDTASMDIRIMESGN